MREGKVRQNSQKGKETNRNSKNEATKGQENDQTSEMSKKKQDEVATGSEVMVAEFATLHLSSDSAESDDAVCPKCGASYADIGGLWVCCDGCNQWFNVECTNIRGKRIPDTFYCEDCRSDS